MPSRIILDVDTGTDDAVALMLAALSPDLELVGATTVVGNCPAAICTENTLRVFQHIGVDIPVYQGMVEPLARPDFPRSGPSVIHGDYLDLSAARSSARQQHAVDWLVETLLASEGDITLLPVGPLTNIAAAIKKEPRVLDKIPELIIMGGAHHVGNRTPSAEFNIWVDPEAARIVLGSGLPIRLVPLDATHKALLALADCSQLRALGTPAAEASAAFTERRIESYSRYQPMNRPDAAPVHDALAVCALLEPDILTTEFIYVDVETRGELTAGRTVCDFGRRSGKQPNVHFAVDAHTQRFKEMLVEILGRTS